MCECKVNWSISLSEQKMYSAVSHPVSRTQLKVFVCDTPQYPGGLYPSTPRRTMASTLLIRASRSVGRLRVSNRPDVERGSRAQQCKAYCSFSFPAETSALLWHMQGKSQSQEGIRMSWNSEEKLNAYPNKLILKLGKGL